MEKTLTLEELNARDCKEQIRAYRKVLHMIAEHTEFSLAIPHEVAMIKASVEGSLIGLKNHLRSIEK